MAWIVLESGYWNVGRHQPPVTAVVVTRRAGQASAGKQNALRLGILGVGMGFVFLTLEVGLRYWGGRSVGLVLALVVWLAVLIPWYLRCQQGDVAYEQRGFYRALYAWALTDIAVVVAMMPLV